MKKQKLNTITTKFRNLIYSENEALGLKPFFFIILILGATSILLTFQEEPSQTTSQAQPKTMDTFIPEGESLVPIKVANYESLDHVMGEFGVVDLYTTPLHPTAKPRRVGFAVKLIRSSLSPNQFSVLVPVEKVARIVSYSGEYTVSVRNPKSRGSQIAGEKKPKQRRSVSYEDSSY